MFMNRNIPVADPKIEQIDIDYVSECVKSTWVSGMSEYVDQFENKFANYCNCKYGITVNSGTTALQVALASLNIKQGDEVIIPTFTMIATPNSIAYTGATPVLVDSEMETWNIDYLKIEEKITDRTKVIMPVHTYGHPANMDPILKLADEYSLYVIEDAAEAHGALYKNKKTGNLGDLNCFSFYANKIITTGEGGMLVTNNKEYAETARWLRSHAFGREGKHFYHEALGFGYRISGMQAALGLAQLTRLDKFVANRRKNAQLYNSNLENLVGKIILPPEATWAKNVYWMYSILLSDYSAAERNEIVKKLEQYGIESRTFFYPVHVQPMYKDLQPTESFPIADTLSQTGINLPSGNNLTEDDINYVCEILHKIL